MDTNELNQQLQEVRRLREVARRKRFGKSRLNRYRAQIELLRNRGASLRDIAIWLRRFKRVKVHPSTVGRAIARWQGE